MENVFALTTVEKRKGVEGAKTTRDTSRDCVKGWTPAPVRCPPDMLARPYGFYASRNGSGGYGKNAENSPVAHGKVPGTGRGGRARSLTRGSNLEGDGRGSTRRIARGIPRRGTRRSIPRERVRRAYALIRLFCEESTSLESSERRKLPGRGAGRGRSSPGCDPAVRISKRIGGV